jgi:arylsulfatase A-like enzyme
MIKVRRRPLGGPPGARRGQPNVLYIVWDDASIAAWNAFGGLIETPSMKGLAGRGLRFSQWHTAALSPVTRSSLLTGRDGAAEPAAAAAAGQDGADRFEPDVMLSPARATLAEIMSGSGYRTYCVGKWDFSPAGVGILTGSRGTWPLARGFDHYYGFLGHQTSQWCPDLIYDNQAVDPPYHPAEGYHLSRDLTDMAMEFIRDGLRAAPGQPWLCYLSLGASGVPHAAPAEWADGYRGRFEAGYDQYREAALANMKRLGVVPEGTGLARADDYCPRGTAAGGHRVRPWHALSEEQKEVGQRLAESAAGLCSYTDHQVGRVFEYLKESGQLEDTIIVACSANATQAGDQGGRARASGVLADWPGPAGITGGLGDLADCDHVLAGWARAFGTPYSMARQSSVGGSAPSPLIISWPRRMHDVAGGVRDQYHHAVDVVPTILDCAGLQPRSRVNGDRPGPLDGVSMRYAFSAPGAPSARPTQLYQMPGAGAIYQEGWKAITVPGRPDGWELYNVSADRAEVHDVAAQYPAKLATLTVQWRSQTSEPPQTQASEPTRPAAAGDPHPAAPRPAPRSGSRADRPKVAR